MEIKIVDAAMLYKDMYTGAKYILVVLNALHVPMMDHNLLPPFILREAGVEVRETLKIQVKDPDERDHSLWFPEAELRIPMGL